ncbi:MAG TPA: Tad domain-containing protein [Myxococcales bacterium]|nr:Tad domain-containing protein [Myxococcales bacterium]
MISTLHTLKRSEEGQTLVLAAIFGLILMLCVLATVNVGRAVYDKVQLQAAADSSAYSLAAVEARVLNFTAYTNRAMVVHFASAMAATSYLTWVHFIWAGLKPILELLQNIPYVGEVIGVIKQILNTLVQILDWGTMALCVLISVANTYIYALQEGAWLATYGRLLKSIQPEAQSGAAAAHPYQAIWPTIIPLANATVFSQTRGHKLMLDNTLEAVKILVNDKSDAVQEARLHMLEIANSARQPWVAYGDRYNNPTWVPFARHFIWSLNLGLASASLGSVGRTEMGGYAPKGGIIGAVESAPPQIWSGQRLQLSASLGPLSHTWNLFSLVAMDQVYNPYDPVSSETHQYIRTISIPSWVPILGGIQDALQSAWKDSAPDPAWRPFWMSPYVYFAPRAHWSPGTGPTGALGNFGQPDVLIGLAYQGQDYNEEPGAATNYGRRFTWGGGQAGVGATDFSYTSQDSTPLLSRGLNALAAAQVYYHRPGDWREQPNFFNPLWGARLMPVTQSNALARTGLNTVARLPFINQLTH